MKIKFIKPLYLLRRKLKKTNSKFIFDLATIPFNKNIFLFLLHIGILIYKDIESPYSSFKYK